MERLTSERSAALVVSRDDVAAWLARTRLRLRAWLCVALNGRHELYRQHERDRIYQRCLLCGHETSGWSLERRGRWKTDGTK